MYNIYDPIKVNKEDSPYHGCTGKVVEIHVNHSPVLYSVQMDKDGRYDLAFYENELVSTAKTLAGMFNMLGNYQTKNINTSKALGPRIVFRCPDNEWTYWIKKWQQGTLSVEPWPYNHVVWNN